jgi:hypothetical protein
MDGAKPPEQRCRGFLGKITNITQWIVFAFVALFAAALVSDIEKSGVPGAPMALFYVSVAVTLVLAVVHLPAVFRRLPRKGKWIAYGAILPAFVLFGAYAGQMNAAWERTSQGAKEAAERAKAEQLAAAETARAKAQEEERLKVERAEAAESAAAEKQASLQAQGQSLCESLVPNVIALSKEGLGPEVIEINNVQVGYTGDTDRLNCTGTAVVSRGEDRSIDFGVRRTPQGKDLVTMQLK